LPCEEKKLEKWRIKVWKLATEIIKWMRDAAEVEKEKCQVENQNWEIGWYGNLRHRVEEEGNDWQYRTKHGNSKINSEYIVD